MKVKWSVLLVLHSLSNFFQPKLGCCLDTIVIVYNLPFGLDTKDLLHYDCYPKHSHTITHLIFTLRVDLKGTFQITSQGAD